MRIAEGEPAGCPRRWRIFDATRGETANVFVIDDRLYMVDCGYGALGALVRAGVLRLRPILMTSSIGVLALLPLAIDTGSGTSLSNKEREWHEKAG